MEEETKSKITVTMAEDYNFSANNEETHVDVKVNSSNDDNHNDVQYSNGNAMIAMPVTMAEDYNFSANNEEKHVDVKVNSYYDDNHNDVQCSNGNAMIAMPVKSGAFGEGLPYAPENWPCVGDKWKWKVGRRITLMGYWTDKSLQAPKHLPNLPASGWFRSRVALQQYIQREFPGANVHAFFSSFINNIPASDDALYELKLARPKAELAQLKAELAQAESELAQSEFELAQSEFELANGPETCKVGNTICQNQLRTYDLPPRSCNVCCSESGFCRDCCCILCCKPIEFFCEGLNFIKCEASMSEMFICGHVAHIDCALRARLAGKVIDAIDLDAQYFCRRCDKKTDLLPHVNKIIKFCESTEENDEVKQFLNLGLCLLRNSERECAKNLVGVIAELMVKHTCAMANPSCS